MNYLLKMLLLSGKELDSEIPAEYQEWANYIDSPIGLDYYPYQVIWSRSDSTSINLAVSTAPMYVSGTSLYSSDNSLAFYILLTNNGTYWGFQSSTASLYSGGGDFVDVLIESNEDIYDDDALATVAFAQTIDAGGSLVPRQVWENYVNTPLSTNDYPYQVIIRYEPNDVNYLILSTEPFYKRSDGSGGYTLSPTATVALAKRYTFGSGAWSTASDKVNYTTSDSFFAWYSDDYLIETNNDIYTSTAMDTVAFAKTT